jgi:hypothetical protein
MVPHLLRFRIRIPIALIAALAWAWAASGLSGPVFAQDKPKGAPIDVLVSGQGTPVPNVKVTVAPDKGGTTPETWTARDSAPLAILATDATGHAVFPDVPPGKYIVTTSCSIPGDWIAGNYATRVETLPGRPTGVTLTLRRGGMVRGKALRGAAAARTAEIRADSQEALMSNCGMMTPSVIDTLTGDFTVNKIPLHATTWVKGQLPFGPGHIAVWKNFRIEKPETLDVAMQFPELGPQDVGTLVLDLVSHSAEKPDSGMAQLLQVLPDGSWRYESTVSVGGVLGPKTYKNLPKGPYQVRAYAIPGSSKWWNAPIDSVTVAGGQVTKHTVKAQIQNRP